MKTQNRSIGATLHNSTEKAAIISSPHVFRRVQKAPSEQGFVEPSPPNLEGLTDEFFDKPPRHQNSLVIPNWTDELKRRVAQFQNTILAKHCGANCTGCITNRRYGTTGPRDWWSRGEIEPLPAAKTAQTPAPESK